MANTTEKQANEWLMRQPIYQIYFPSTKKISRHNDSFSDYLSINAIHEADVLYLPHDNGFKYVLAVVDVATRCKTAVPLVNKTSKTVADAFRSIYDTGLLKPPTQLSVDEGKEFFKDVTTYFKSKGTNIYRSHERDLMKLWRNIYLGSNTTKKYRLVKLIENGLMICLRYLKQLMKRKLD